MQAMRDNPSIPAWSVDQLDSPQPPATEAPCFDTALGAWVLSRHADILAAFRSAGLFPAGPDSGKPAVQSSESDHLKMRTETAEALASSRLNAWRTALQREAEAAAETLPVDTPVDLLAAYARPLCLSHAAVVTGVTRHLAQQLCAEARAVSAASAEPYDATLRPGAGAANEELCRYFHSGPESLRDSGFVALSQTMPCLLGNAWYALIEHSDQWALLHRNPELMDNAIEELLRYAGLVRILSRAAAEDLDLNGAHIRKGDRVILRIVAGNRDPERFTNPNDLTLARRDAGHLTLGAGSHACVGASLIRMVMAAVTRPLLQRFASATFTSPVAWQGGSGFRSPQALPVALSRNGGQSHATAN
jgi:cytochrome P450